MDPCVIHRYSMGLCVKCNEPPLGGPATAPNAVFVRVTRENWEEEYVYCPDCERYGEWYSGTGSACPKSDCAAKGTKCANKVK